MFLSKHIFLKNWKEIQYLGDDSVGAKKSIDIKRTVLYIFWIERDRALVHVRERCSQESIIKKKTLSEGACALQFIVHLYLLDDGDWQLQNVSFLRHYYSYIYLFIAPNNVHACSTNNIIYSWLKNTLFTFPSTCNVKKTADKSTLGPKHSFVQLGSSYISLGTFVCRRTYVYSHSRNFSSIRTFF